MELKDIYGLLDRFENSSCAELELDMNGVHLGLKKGMACSGEVQTVQERVQGLQTEKPQSQNEAAVPDKTEGTVIEAPLVGTFYAAAGPDEEPFVKIGQQVHAGDVIGIIEAMKLMNEVTASSDGIVAEIKAENGKMVEYGQPLVVLK